MTSPSDLSPRRRFLAVVAAAGTATAAGCADGTGTAETGTPTESTVAGTSRADPTTDGATTTIGMRTDTDGTHDVDVAEDIVVVVYTDTDDERTVRLTVTADGETVSEREVTVPPNGPRYVDPRIRERGKYELAVEVVDGPSASYPFDIDGYDLRMGSNLIVEVDDDRVNVMIEE